MTDISSRSINRVGQPERILRTTSTDREDLFSELRSEDELVVLARGLGLIRVVTNLLHAYDAIGNNLIVLVGADDRENGWIGEGPLA
jgi:hypothetical protein